MLFSVGGTPSENCRAGRAAFCVGCTTDPPLRPTMKAGDNPIRTVITGVGVVSPIGIGNDAFWQSLMEGRSGIGHLRAFPSDALPTKLAAQIHDFDPDHLVGSKKLLKVMSRDIQLGVVAASPAMRDTSLTAGAVDPDRLGVSFGAG